MENDASTPDPFAWYPPDGVRPTFLPPEDFPQWPRLPEETSVKPFAPEWPGGPHLGAPTLPPAPEPAGLRPAAPSAAWAPPPEGWEPRKPTPWAVPVEAGVPFLRLGRNTLFRWWRPVLGTVVLVGAALGVMLAVLVVWGLTHWAITGDEAGLTGGIFGGTTEDLALQLVSLAVLLPIVLLVTWGIGRRPAGTVVSVEGRMRWRWLLACVGLGIGFVAAFYALNIAVSMVFEPDSAGEPFVGWAEFWKPALVIILLVPFQSAAEEFVFRGWLLQAVGSYRLLWGALPAMVVSSALFVLGHGYTGWAMLDIFVFAMVAAWLVLRTGGLEASIALHVLNNLLAFLLPAATGTLSLEQGGAPWYILLITVPPLLLYAAAVLALARRTRVRTVTQNGTGPHQEARAVAVS